MTRELVQLQVLTLGSLVVLVLLCAGLLLVVWLALHLSQLLERVRATLSRFTTEAQRHGDLERADDDRGPPTLSKQSFPEGESGTDPFRNGRGGTIPRPVGQSTGTGSSPSVPPCLRGEHIASPYHAGQAVIAAEEMNWIGGSGIVVPVGALLRLVACHDTQAGRRWSATWKKCHLSSIPEDMLEPLRRIVVKSDDAVDHAQCEREYLAQQHELTTHQPTASG